jgi:predicted  nucleic acid-binding Zn-ribbon protein
MTDPIRIPVDYPVTITGFTGITITPDLARQIVALVRQAKPVGAGPACAFGQDWKNRAWAAYCADAKANTIDKGKNACSGSRWGWDTWEQMPQELRDEYACKVASDRITLPPDVFDALAEATPPADDACTCGPDLDLHNMSTPGCPKHSRTARTTPPADDAAKVARCDCIDCDGTGWRYSAVEGSAIPCKTCCHDTRVIAALRAQLAEATAKLESANQAAIRQEDGKNAALRREHKEEDLRHAAEQQRDEARAEGDSLADLLRRARPRLECMIGISGEALCHEIDAALAAKDAK